jgi:hypothetical protein
MLLADYNEPVLTIKHMLLLNYNVCLGPRMSFPIQYKLLNQLLYANYQNNMLSLVEHFL